VSVREDLKAYLDGELSPSRMEEVRAAVEADPVLQEEVEYMKALAVEIRRLSEEPQIVGMEKVLGAVKGRSSRLSPWTLRPAFAGGAVCVLLLFASAAVLYPVFAQSKSRAMNVSTNKAAAAGSVEAEFKSDLRGTTNSAPYDFVPGAKAEDEAKSKSEAGALSSEGGDIKPGSADMARPDAKERDAVGTPESGKSIEHAQTATRGRGSAFVEEQHKTDRFGRGETTPRNPTSAPVATRDLLKSMSAKVPPAKPVLAANIVVHVEDLALAERQATQVATDEGGFAQSEPAPMPDSPEKRQITLCVPSSNMGAALKSVRSIGKVVEEKVKKTDAASEHRNLSSQLNTLKRQLGDWGTRLKGKAVRDQRPVQGQIDNLNSQIAQVRERQSALAEDPPMSSIVATIEKKDKEPAPSGFRYAVERPSGDQAAPDSKQAPTSSPNWAALLLGGVAALALLGALAWALVRRR
jgi:hypothetical protein